MLNKLKQLVVLFKQNLSFKFWTETVLNKVGGSYILKTTRYNYSLINCIKLFDN